MNNLTGVFKELVRDLEIRLREAGFEIHPVAHTPLSESVAEARSEVLKLYPWNAPNVDRLIAAVRAASERLLEGYRQQDRESTEEINTLRQRVEELEKDLEREKSDYYRCHESWRMARANGVSELRAAEVRYEETISSLRTRIADLESRQPAPLSESVAEARNHALRYKCEKSVDELIATVRAESRKTFDHLHQRVAELESDLARVASEREAGTYSPATLEPAPAADEAKPRM